MPTLKPQIDRYAEIGALAVSAQLLIQKTIWPICIALAFEVMLLSFSGHPGTKAFMLISLGGVLVLTVWRSAGQGLPILPVIGLQTLIAYALPIVNNNETVMAYSEDYMTQGGVEVLIFCCAMAGAWKFGMQMFQTSSPMCYALQGFDEEKMTKLSRLGISLMVSASMFEVLQSINLLDFILNMLPSGSFSIVNVLLSAVSACGFFLTAMLVGKGGTSSGTRVLFWSLLFLHCFISASSFLLSSTITIIFSVLIGLFWGGGRVPWRFVIVVTSIIGFLNLGKFNMREAYWRSGELENIPTFRLDEMPEHYIEWIDASISALKADEEESVTNRAALEQAKKKKSQSIMERINNLQNLLYVIDAEDAGKIAPLGGATYSLIPPLLVPRIIWPDKPRTHEGQVLLNVHFGRQDLNSTFQTYVAWGLLAEAYGNFGPIAGAIFIGSMLGLGFAWVEKFTARKILLSMEGFLSFTFMLGMSNSFEMVASVLITTIFQSFIPIILASKPFTERVTPRRLEQPA